jgi:hypothetical protein
MSEFEKLNLKKLNGIKIDDLILDPNNPRFSKHHRDLTPLENYDLPEVQEETLRLMNNKSFEIDDLISSIKTKGFVNIDNIFVKRLNSKYLIIEGNRRITAIKNLLKLHADGKIKDIPEDIYNTFKKIDCIDLTENKADEVDFVLGLRHHGSIKPWDALPSAFNIYKRYMVDFCKLRSVVNNPDQFEYDTKIAKTIANLYSIKLSEVRDKLKTYRVYLQLYDALYSDFNNNENYKLETKFSMILETITQPALRQFFKFNDITCIFDNEGLDLFINLYFGKNDQNPVITEAAAGNSNVRDLAYIVSTGTEEDIRQIVEERKDASVVKADIVSERQKRTIDASLLRALNELKEIKIGNDLKDWQKVKKKR